MRIPFLGLEITRPRAAMTSVSTGGDGWFNIIKEHFGGAWQQNVAIDAPRDVLSFSAVFSCVSIIAGDIAKLGVNLKRRNPTTKIFENVEGNSPFLNVLRKPNRYQTWYKFIEQWVVQKLLWGNAYILKERDQRGVVVGLYVLDSQRVTCLVAEDGGVYYQLSKDFLSGLLEPVTIPAREIIHDTMISLWHPLVGVTPIYACGLAATMGSRIMKNSTLFFQNMSRPAGQLTSPGTISDETANRLKKHFEENYSGSNIGRLMVAGDGLKYEPMTIPASDAQLLEQLKWSVEDVARCFHVPLWKLGGQEPARTSVESLNQTYYSDCLQTIIESAEALLCEGLALPSDMMVQLDLDNLLRMDTAARYLARGQAVKDGWMSPNEARAREDMPPVAGGESPYLQQQNYSLQALAKRDKKEDPFEVKGAGSSSTLPAPTRGGAANDEQAQQMLALISAEFVRELRADAPA